MKAERSVLVCFPLTHEAAPFRKIAAEKSGVDILLTGIGRRNAERSLRDFLAVNSADLVLTCGFAGGLNPDLKLGDVIFEFGIRNSEFGIKLAAAGAKPAKFFCADRIATTAAEKKKLGNETGADAVEMESAAIYAVCREHNIPCGTVRVISDTASEDLPLDFNQLSRPDQSLDYGKLFLAIAKSPGKIGALMKLQKQTQFAAERLAQVLAGAL
jgi:adenosylhomocysteine nucleosidase